MIYGAKREVVLHLFDAPSPTPATPTENTKMAILNFDTRTAPPPRDDFEIVPAGEYPAIISDSVVKDTKSGTGKYLELTETILDGPNKGRKVWVRLNLWNNSQKAVEIAQRDMSAICAAVGFVGELKDSALLHNKPHIIRVDVELADASKNRNNDQNVIRAWKAMTGAGQVSTSAQQNTAAPAANGAPPWAGQNAA